MAEGIECSAFFLILLTKAYEDKVNLQAGKETENCNLEFSFAQTKKPKDKFIIIVRDERMLNTAKWTGKLGLQCSTLLYIDGLNQPLDVVVQDVLKILKKDVRALHHMSMC